MQKTDQPLAALEPRRLTQRYQNLLAQLSSIGSISQGSVMHQPPGAWRWTRKVNARTLSVALSAEQAKAMKQAISNQRRLTKIIKEMREITQKLILETTPNVRRKSEPNNPKSRLS